MLAKLVQSAHPLGSADPLVAVAMPGDALCGLWTTCTGMHRLAPVGPTYRTYLGQQCACERSSSTLSHVCMMIVNADSNTCRRNHLVPCCPLHGCWGRCVPDTVGAYRRLGGWSSATVMTRINAPAEYFEWFHGCCATFRGL